MVGGRPYRRDESPNFKRCAKLAVYVGIFDTENLVGKSLSLGLFIVTLRTPQHL